MIWILYILLGLYLFISLSHFVLWYLAVTAMKNPIRLSGKDLRNLTWKEIGKVAVISFGWPYQWLRNYY